MRKSKNSKRKRNLKSKRTALLGVGTKDLSDGIKNNSSFDIKLSYICTDLKNELTYVTKCIS
jgi:hypothetical protein